MLFKFSFYRMHYRAEKESVRKTLILRSREESIRIALQSRTPSPVAGIRRDNRQQWRINQASLESFSFTFAA